MTPTIAVVLDTADPVFIEALEGAELNIDVSLTDSDKRGDAAVVGAWNGVLGERWNIRRTDAATEIVAAAGPTGTGRLDPGKRYQLHVQFNPLRRLPDGGKSGSVIVELRSVSR